MYVHPYTHHTYLYIRTYIHALDNAISNVSVLAAFIPPLADVSTPDLCLLPLCLSVFFREELGRRMEVQAQAPEILLCMTSKSSNPFLANAPAASLNIARVQWCLPPQFYRRPAQAHPRNLRPSGVSKGQDGPPSGSGQPQSSLAARHPPATCGRERPRDSCRKASFPASVAKPLCEHSTPRRLFFLQSLLHFPKKTSLPSRFFARSYIHSPSSERLRVRRVALTSSERGSEPCDVPRLGDSRYSRSTVFVLHDCKRTRRAGPAGFARDVPL